VKDDLIQLDQRYIHSLAEYLKNLFISDNVITRCE